MSGNVLLLKVRVAVVGESRGSFKLGSSTITQCFKIVENLVGDEKSNVLFHREDCGHIWTSSLLRRISYSWHVRSTDECFVEGIELKSHWLVALLMISFIRLRFQVQELHGIIILELHCI